MASGVLHAAHSIAIPKAIATIASIKCMCRSMAVQTYRVCSMHRVVCSSIQEIGAHKKSLKLQLSIYFEHYVLLYVFVGSGIRVRQNRIIVKNAV